MRRNRLVGIGALQKDKQRLELFQQKGSSLAKEELEKLSCQMGDFRANLEKFALKYKKDIKKSGEFRRNFQQMCAVAGVEPLRSSASFWAKLLGVGDFYYELAVQVTEVLLSTSHRNGGILSLEELLRRVQASRGPQADPVTREDVLEAVRKLRVLGGNVRALPAADSHVIHATPAELNPDLVEVARLAHRTRGRVSAPMLAEAAGWAPQRCQKALDELTMEGLVWLDAQAPAAALYCFPALN